MSFFLKSVPFLALLTLGVICARRWLVNPSAKIEKSPPWARITALVFTCWIGSFFASAASREIGFIINEGIAYDGTAEVPYDVIHDGTGDNAVSLFLGWLIGPVCWGLAAIRFREK